MGIWSSIKRILFASESIAKSSAQKASDNIKYKAQEVSESAKKRIDQTTDEVRDRTSGLKEAISDEAKAFGGRLVDAAKEIKDKAEDFIEDLDDEPGNESASDTVQYTEHTKSETEEGGDSIDFKENQQRFSSAGTTESEEGHKKDFRDKARDAVDAIGKSAPVQKAADVAENVGRKVLDTSDDLIDKAMRSSEKIGEEILDRGKDLSDKINKKIDDTVEKAEREAAEEAANPKGKYSDETLDASGSLLDEDDDFFNKASRYADGDYGAFSEGKIEISDKQSPPEKKNPAKAAGYEDLDGDGNELIDDAIISEEE